MPEAVVVLLQYAFESLKLHRIEVNINSAQRPSRRVVEKLGIRFEESPTLPRRSTAWEEPRALPPSRPRSGANRRSGTRRRLALARDATEPASALGGHIPEL